jgi:hypothetical protein
MGHPIRDRHTGYAVARGKAQPTRHALGTRLRHRVLRDPGNLAQPFHRRRRTPSRHRNCEACLPPGITPPVPPPPTFFVPKYPRRRHPTQAPDAPSTRMSNANPMHLPPLPEEGLRVGGTRPGPIRDAWLMALALPERRDGRKIKGRHAEEPRLSANPLI